MSYMLMPQGLENLRNARLTTHRKALKRLADQCRRYEKENLPIEHPLKSITYYGMAACNLALMYKLTGQKQYLAEARRWIFAGCDYPHWGKAVKVDVDLSAAWLLFGYGICYNWLKEDLTPTDRNQLLSKLILQGQRMYQYAVDTGLTLTKGEGDADAVIRAAEGKDRDVLTGKSWANTYWQNHNWIDYTGLLAAAYAIRGEYAQAQVWIDHVNANFKHVFACLPEDGSDYEGIVYWRYGVIWLFLYAELARENGDGDYYKESEFLKNTFFYRLYQLAPDRQQNVNFGDCHDRRSGHIPCLYYKVASEYGNGYAQSLADEVLERYLAFEGYESGVKPGILPEAFLEYLWYNPAVEKKDITELPTRRFFADLGLLSQRTSWDYDASLFSFKAAPGGGHKQWKLSAAYGEWTDQIRSMGHNHPDEGSFVLIRGGDYLAVDEGYSGAKKTRNHNMILVDGIGYPGDGAYDVYQHLKEDQIAQVLDYQEAGDGFFLRSELSGLYQPDLGMKKMQRDILSSGRWYVFVDTLESDLPHTYTWLIHADEMPEKKNDHYEFRNALSKMDLYPSDLDIRFGTTIMTNSANVTSQEPDNIVYTRLYTLCQENKLPVKKMTFVNVLFAGDITEEHQVTYSREEDILHIRIDGEEVRIDPKAEKPYTYTTQNEHWEF